MDEAHDYFRQPIPEAFAAKLARRALAVFAKHPFWQRKYKSANGRGYILSSMRHWLAGVLAKENPVLFRQLPESFKIGLPLHKMRLGAQSLARCRYSTEARSARAEYHALPWLRPRLLQTVTVRDRHGLGIDRFSVNLPATNPG